MGKKRVPPGEKRKPGPQGKFKGLRLEYLTSRLSAYETAVATSKTWEFWTDVYAGYWKRVEWRKALDEETDAAMFRDASVSIETNLSEADAEHKTEKLKKVNKVCLRPTSHHLLVAQILVYCRASNPGSKIENTRPRRLRRIPMLLGSNAFASPTLSCPKSST